MSTTPGDLTVSPANAEAIEAWDGPLFERFVKYRHIVVAASVATRSLIGSPIAATRDRQAAVTWCAAVRLRPPGRIHAAASCAYSAVTSWESCDLTARVVSSARISNAPAMIASAVCAATSRGSAFGAVTLAAMSVSI